MLQLQSVFMTVRGVGTVDFPQAQRVSISHQRVKPLTQGGSNAGAFLGVRRPVGGLSYSDTAAKATPTTRVAGDVETDMCQLAPCGRWETSCPRYVPKDMRRAVDREWRGTAIRSGAVPLSHAGGHFLLRATETGDPPWDECG